MHPPDTTELMRQRLSELEPESLDIEDESAAHAGHAGAASGGHYRLTLASARFSGLNPVARHRLVYQTLGDLMGTRIHALSLTVLSPEEL